MRGLGLIKSLFKSGPDSTSGPSEERRHVARVDAREGLRILIVDDSSTVVAVLGKLLRQNAYETLEASSGEQAIEIALRERPELVFLDIVLPTMSGFAVLRALRRDPSTHDVPVIMISGNLRATEEFYGQRIGADDFMKKPFGRSEVFTRIQNLVERGRLPRREDSATALPIDDASDELVADTIDGVAPDMLAASDSRRQQAPD